MEFPALVKEVKHLPHPPLQKKKNATVINTCFSFLSALHLSVGAWGTRINFRWAVTSKLFLLSLTTPQVLIFHQGNTLILPCDLENGTRSAKYADMLKKETPYEFHRYFLPRRARRHLDE